MVAVAVLAIIVAALVLLAVAVTRTATTDDDWPDTCLPEPKPCPICDPTGRHLGWIDHHGLTHNLDHVASPTRWGDYTRTRTVTGTYNPALLAAAFGQDTTCGHCGTPIRYAPIAGDWWHVQTGARACAPNLERPASLLTATPTIHDRIRDAFHPA